MKISGFTVLLPRFYRSKSLLKVLHLSPKLFELNGNRVITCTEIYPFDFIQTFASK